MGHLARSTPPSFDLNWERTRKAEERSTRLHTWPSRSCALDVALGMLLDGGLDAGFERHMRLGRACRAGIKAMGLELFSPDEDRSAVVTAAPACPMGWTRPSWRVRCATATA